MRRPRIALKASRQVEGGPQFHGRLRLLAFWDYGGAYHQNRVPGDPTGRYLSSIGVNFGHHVVPYVDAYFDYGWQQHRSGLDSDNGSRAAMGIIVSY